MISCVLSEINQPLGRSKSKLFKFKADLRNKRDAVSDKILKGGLERQLNSGCLPGSILSAVKDGGRECKENQGCRPRWEE